MDSRFLQERGKQVFTGTELLLKGALEGRVSLLTGYPGSPIADFFNQTRNIKDYLNEKGIVVQIANNEALAAARANGSQMEDIKAVIAMKSVGAHVASDGLALGNLSKASNKGGVLVVIGDDPWSESTQVPADSRYLSKHLHMPVMEPATFQELKDWVSVGLDLSAKSNLYISYLVTTNLADGGGTVTVYANQVPTINTKRPVEIDTKSIPVEETVVLSPRTAVREETLADRYEELIRYGRLYEVNKILYAGSSKKVGFVTSGLAYSYLEQAMQEFGLEGKFPILKLGITYPLDESLVYEFCTHLEQIVVVEEKRDFVESQIAMMLKNFYQTGRMSKPLPVWGKTFPYDLPGLPATRGLNSSLLMERLGPLFAHFKFRDHGVELGRIEREIALIQETASYQVSCPKRTPTFCPGCPHRDSSSVLLEVKRKFRDGKYMKKHFNREPVDLLFHGDTGCYTMLMFEPNSDLMHNYSGMGLGGGTGAGINPFITNKQAVFMGDSTFFHSGMIAISDAIKHGQDITFFILDNGSTAMTGHQPTPSQEYDLVGNRTVAQNIEEIVKGMAKGTEIPIVRTNPGYRTQYRRLVEEIILQDGVKVVIADKECGITHDRKMTRQEKSWIRKIGYLPKKRFINLTPEVCEHCLECTMATGCPGLTIAETAYGQKLITDLTLCKADGACTKIDACPSFEEVVVKRSQPPKEFLDLDVQALEDPQCADFDGKWSVYIAGVGGMGIGVVTAILVQAGMKQGYHIKFCEKKGLAIRNGGVYSHILFAKEEQPITPITLYGKTNLLIGLDIVEAVRSIDPKINLRVSSPRYTSAIVNTHKTPTVSMLLGKEDFSPRQLEESLRRASRSDRYFGADVSEVAETFLGSKLFSNMVLLGVVYQKGLLPIDLKNMNWAIEKSVPKDAVKENMEAFNLGRLLSVDPSRFIFDYTPTYESVLNEKEDILRTTHWRGDKIARAYRNSVIRTAAALRMDDETNMQLALRIYDLVQFENISWARTYVDLVKKVHHLDRAEYGWKATRAAIRGLHKVMALKDEIYVAHLLTSIEKIRRDMRRYRIDPARGDKLEYRHINQPEFVLFGMRFRFHMRTYNWQLNIMKHMKFLRRLLPGWHAKEKAFRKWYIDLVEKFNHRNLDSYLAYVRALEVPLDVKGYREVAYEKMDLARRKVEAIFRSEPPSPGTHTSKFNHVKP